MGVIDHHRSFIPVSTAASLELYEKEALYRCLPVKFVNFLGKQFFVEHLRMAAFVLSETILFTDVVFFIWSQSFSKRFLPLQFIILQKSLVGNIEMTTCVRNDDGCGYLGDLNNYWSQSRGEPKPKVGILNPSVYNVPFSTIFLLGFYSAPIL